MSASASVSAKRKESPATKEEKKKKKQKAAPTTPAKPTPKRKKQAATAATPAVADEKEMTEEQALRFFVDQVRRDPLSHKTASIVDVLTWKKYAKIKKYLEPFIDNFIQFAIRCFHNCRIADVEDECDSVEGQNIFAHSFLFFRDLWGEADVDDQFWMWRWDLPKTEEEIFALAAVSAAMKNRTRHDPDKYETEPTQEQRDSMHALELAYLRSLFPTALQRAVLRDVLNVCVPKRSM